MIEKKPRVSPDEYIASIVDAPQEEFESIVGSTANQGDIQYLTVLLSSVYAQLRQNKDDVIQLVYEGVLTKDDAEAQRILEGLYAEMFKVEHKITYLKKRNAEIAGLPVKSAD